MSVLISGSTGFVGINLKEYLNGRGLTCIPLDLRTTKTIPHENYDAVIHLAGKAHDLANQQSAKDYYDINFELTKVVFDEFLKSGATKFIFMSSVKAVTDHTEVSLDEDFVPNPQTHYGKSKRLAELYIESQILPSGKSYYILRPCMIHGAGIKGNLTLLYKLISRKIPFPLAAFENKRSFLSVENLCFVIKEILEQSIDSGIYHLADDGVLSTNELVTLIGDSLGYKTRFWKINKTLIEFFIIKISYF